MQAVLDQGQLWLLEPTGVQHWRLETAGGERGGGRWDLVIGEAALRLTNKRNTPSSRITVS